MNTQSTGSNITRDVYSKAQKDVSTRQVAFKNKSLKPLQSIENTTASKQIKERSFIPSRYKAHHHEQKNNEAKKQKQEPGTLSVIQHSFNSVNSPHRIELTKQRPTMGGKTIGAIRSDCNDKKRLSSQELKLLSRRIDPKERLSSPHASPSKPPLPNLSSKRPRSPNITSTQNNVNINTRQFICLPCNKRYKNRNGLAYHQERCKNRKEQDTEQQEAKHDNNIQCICLFPTAVTKPLVECKKCNTFLHQNCLGYEVQLQLDDYCCPRCEDKVVESHLLDNGTFVNLSDLAEAKERGKNLLKSLKEAKESDEQQEQAGNSNFDFVRLFADENNSEDNAELQECDPIIWDPPTDLSGTWYFPDVPSLIFSSDACPSSALDDDSILRSDATFDLPSDFTTLNNDLPSDLADLPSSPLQPDWLDFANFEDDFTC